MRWISEMPEKKVTRGVSGQLRLNTNAKDLPE